VHFLSAHKTILHEKKCEQQKKICGLAQKEKVDVTLCKPNGKGILK
jgi:hypothetical protein